MGRREGGREGERRRGGEEELKLGIACFKI